MGWEQQALLLQPGDPVGLWLPAKSNLQLISKSGRENVSPKGMAAVWGLW